VLRVAVIGAGWAGARQIEAARELGRKIEIDCVVDSDVAFLASRSAEFGIGKTFTDYRQALADGEVDAVSICLPHGLHREVAVEAARAGKHVLVEKPIALTVDEATEMIDAAGSAVVRLYVAENLPYSPMARLLRYYVREERAVGEVLSASWINSFRAPDYGYPGRRAWLASPEAGGTWMLHGIHSVAMMRHVLGEVETVYMRPHRARSFRRDDLEGTVSGLATLDGGASVHVVQSCEVDLPADFARYVIHGDEGTIRATREECELLRAAEGHAGSLRYVDRPTDELSEYARELEAFADYVSGEAVGPTTAESERRSLAVVQAGYESALAGEPVILRERFGDI
jgi:predicted dehydrogenase